MSPCQFFRSGQVKRLFVAATALASATPFVLGGTLVAVATAVFVGETIAVRLTMSGRGIVSAADHALLSTIRLLVSERIRPGMRSPFLSSRETVCAKMLPVARHTPATHQRLLRMTLVIGVCDARGRQITQ